MLASFATAAAAWAALLWAQQRGCFYTLVLYGPRTDWALSGAALLLTPLFLVDDWRQHPDWSFVRLRHTAPKLVPRGVKRAAFATLVHTALPIYALWDAAVLAYRAVGLVARYERGAG